jgi:hypothetical protein
VADADYDCRPPRVRPTAFGTESPSRFFGMSHPTLVSGPLKTLRFQPCQTMWCWHSASAHSARMATVQPGRIGAGFRTSGKNAVQAGLV